MWRTRLFTSLRLLSASTIDCRKGLRESGPNLVAANFTRIPDKDDQRLIAHFGAIRVAHSARAEEAFRVLVNFETVNEGNVLISLIDALADCAAAVISSGRVDAQSILWRSTRGDQPTHRRIAAAATLGRLIRRQLLRSSCVSEVLDLTRDESLHIFARRELLGAVGHVRQSVPD